MKTLLDVLYTFRFIYYGMVLGIIGDILLFEQNNLKNNLLASVLFILICFPVIYLVDKRFIKKPNRIL